MSYVFKTKPIEIMTSPIHHHIEKSKKDETTVAHLRDKHLHVPSPSKSKSLKDRIIEVWTRIKKSCCIRKIISLWQRLFSKMDKDKTIDVDAKVSPDKKKESLTDQPKTPEKKSADTSPQIHQQIAPLAKAIEEPKEILANQKNAENEEKLKEKSEIVENANIFSSHLIGKKMSLAEAVLQINPDNPKDFNEGELVIALRSDLSYQYGQVIQKYKNEYIIDVKEPKSFNGHIQKKPDEIFKLKMTLSTEPIVEYLPDEPSTGPRTRSMISFLQMFKDFKNEKLHLTIQNQTVAFTPLTAAVRDISTKPVASCGSSLGREILVLDPKNSPLLDAHYEKIKTRLQNQINLSEKQILAHVMLYILDEIFPIKNDPKMDKIDDFIRSLLLNPPFTTKTHNGKTITVAPIEEFVKVGLGFCRHHGIVLANILDRLTKEKKPILKGIVQHMRDNVPQTEGKMGGHIWVTFISSEGEKKKWHIDSFWMELCDFSSQSGIDHLKKRYGNEAIENQILKSKQIIT